MNLKIDYSQTRTLAAKVKSNAGDFANVLGMIKSTNENLKNYWKGDDANKYLGAVEEQAKTMDKLKDTIEEIGQFLDKVASAYEQVNEANQRGINMN